MGMKDEVRTCANGMKCGVVEWVKRYTLEVVWSS